MSGGGLGPVTPNSWMPPDADTFHRPGDPPGIVPPNAAPGELFRGGDALPGVSVLASGLGWPHHVSVSADEEAALLAIPAEHRHARLAKLRGDGSR